MNALARHENVKLFIKTILQKKKLPAKKRDNFAPSTCQNLSKFIRPKPNIKDLFGKFVFLSDLSPNIVFPCQLLLLTHSLRLL